MIGFDITGKKSKSVTKWEDSLFGGYYRTVMDYPDVKVHSNVDFDFGTIAYGSYFLKEKILKIFLSKVKTHGYTTKLLDNCTVERKRDAWGDEITEATVDNNSKLSTIRAVIAREPEFAPMFSHYMKFIMDTRIYFYKSNSKAPSNGTGSSDDDFEEFKDENENDESSGKSEEEKSKNGNSGKGKEKEKEEEKPEETKDESSGDGEGEEKEEPENSESDGSNSEEEKEEEKGDGEGEGEEKSPEDKALEDKLEKELEKRKQEIEEREQKAKQKPVKKLTQAEINQIQESFKKAIQSIVEESIVHSYISGFKKPVKVIFERPNVRDTEFNYEDKRIAENLVKMLDISFDPAKEIVKNLRLGKLDISKIAEVPAGNIAIYKQDVENQTTKPFSIVILCDESGSMGSGHEYKGRGDKLYSQYRIVKQLYLAFSDIIPQNKLYVYGHSGSEEPELYVYQDSYRPNFTKTIDHMIHNHNHHSNYDGPAIEEVYNQVRNSTDDRIIFICLSDGQPAGNNYGGHDDQLKMKQIIEKCKRDEFVTVGVGIQYFTVKNLYQYSTVVTDLDEMAKKVSHIVNHVVKSEFQ